MSKPTTPPSGPLKRKREDDIKRGALHQKRIKLLETRKQLPIWQRQSDIRRALQNHHVLILSGETGSGKSTQVPQFLLAEPWCLTGGRKIAITQPRRVAAISLARRVAEEMGTPLGSASPASKVGYSVRFDDNTSPSTRIKYLTEGMLLQELLRDATLSQYGCVVVDEVHERSVNVDLILGFLKQILLGRGRGRERKTPLKVVIMSATADVEGLRSFFSGVMGVTSGDLATGRPSANVEEFQHGSEASRNGCFDDETPNHPPLPAMCHVEGRQYPVTTHYLATATDDLLEAALTRVFHIHTHEPMPGDILVFLTGQEIIQSLQHLIDEYAQSLTSEHPKLLVLPLFAALPQTAQQLIFEPAPRATRKVILSTNIAETSVTVPGVRYVIDTGKAKVKQFRNRLGLDSLLVKPISRSSAEQRRGRAGREGPGWCYRLYTEESYRSLDQNTIPEILRCDLSSALLTMKARGVDDVLNFPYLTPPPREAIEKALLHLLELGALKEADGTISPIGRQIARLPLPPSLGRVIVEAARPEMDCLPHVIDIVACLSVENIFPNGESEESREQAQVARQQLFRRQGDHLTLLAAVQAYAGEHSDRKRWCVEHLVSHRAMRSVMDVRKQLTAQCRQAKLLPSFETSVETTTTTTTTTTNTTSSSSLFPVVVEETTQENILKCFLRGFGRNVARLCPDGSYKTFVGNQTVAIHPSSVLFGRKVEGILYNEFVYTNKAYARGVSVIQLRWLEGVWKG